MTRESANVWPKIHLAPTNLPPDLTNYLEFFQIKKSLSVHWVQGGQWVALLGFKIVRLCRASLNNRRTYFSQVSSQHYGRGWDIARSHPTHFDIKKCTYLLPTSKLQRKWAGVQIEVDIPFTSLIIDVLYDMVVNWMTLCHVTGVKTGLPSQIKAGKSSSGSG